MPLSDKIPRRSLWNIAFAAAVATPVVFAVGIYMAARWYLPEAMIGQPIDLDNDGKLEYHIMLETLKRVDGDGNDLPAWQWIFDEITGTRGNPLYVHAFVSEEAILGFDSEKFKKNLMSNSLPVVWRPSVYYLLESDGKPSFATLPVAGIHHNYTPRITNGRLEFLNDGKHFTKLEGTVGYFADEGWRLSKRLPN